MGKGMLILKSIPRCGDDLYKRHLQGVPLIKATPMQGKTMPLGKALAGETLLGQRQVLWYPRYFGVSQGVLSRVPWFYRKHCRRSPGPKNTLFSLLIAGEKASNSPMVLDMQHLAYTTWPAFIMIVYTLVKILCINGHFGYIHPLHQHTHIYNFSKHPKSLKTPIKPKLQVATLHCRIRTCIERENFIILVHFYARLFVYFLVFVFAQTTWRHDDENVG